MQKTKGEINANKFTFGKKFQLEMGENNECEYE
jgi:hypothetical protein